MKVYIVSTCHPSCFIQHRSPFTFSFDVKSKMAADILLPVILSELVDYDKMLCRGKMLEWIRRRHQSGSFQNIIKELTVEDRYAFKEMFRISVEDYETVLMHIDDLSLHLMYVIAYGYYFAERFSLVWKIRSRANFYPICSFFIQHDFFFLRYFCVLLKRSNISSNMVFFYAGWNLGSVWQGLIIFRLIQID